MKEFSFTRLGKNILAIRTRLKLTQLDFAALFDHVPGSGDTRRSNVSLYEAGKSRPPMEFVFEIAAKTGFTLDELFGEVLDQRILGRSLAEPGDSYIIGVSDPEPALPQRARGSWVRYETLQRLFLEAFRRGGLREGGYFDQGAGGYSSSRASSSSCSFRSFATPSALCKSISRLGLKKLRVLVGFPQ